MLVKLGVLPSGMIAVRRPITPSNLAVMLLRVASAISLPKYRYLQAGKEAGKQVRTKMQLLSAHYMTSAHVPQLLGQ